MSIDLDYLGISSLFSPLPLLATATGDNAPSVLNGVLLSLVAIYLASKIGAEIAKRFDLPPILGELVAGVIIGISGLQLIVFPDGGMVGSDSAIVQFLQSVDRKLFSDRLN